MRQLESSGSAPNSDPTTSSSDGPDVFVRSLAKLSIQDANVDNKIPITNASAAIQMICRLIGLATPQASKSQCTSAMLARRIVSNLLDQLQSLWSLVVLHIDPMARSRQDAGSLIRDFFETLLDLAPRIVTIKLRMNIVQRYCLLWTACVEDCFKTQALADRQFSLDLVHVIHDHTLRATEQIPELALTLNSQLGSSRQEDATEERSGSPANYHPLVRRVTHYLVVCNMLTCTGVCRENFA